MRIIPNIFLQGTRVVSLYKGTENEQKKVYPKAAKSYAAHFDKEGAKTLFIVDLNGNQREHLPELRKAFTKELWWSGKIRDEESIQNLLDQGVDRIVLGQSAEPIFTSALARFGAEKLLAGLQLFHYDEAPMLCERYKEMGFTDLVVKDMNAEGTLFHPNFDLIEKCKYFSGANIFASGGITEEHHLRLLQQAGATGAIIGRAFYENHLDLVSLRSHFEHD